MSDYNAVRRKTKAIKVGGIYIGGDSPVSVQSMTNTKTSDINATVNQLTELERAGCDLARLAVPDEESARAFFALKEAGIKMPLCADIHFDYRLAISAAEAGADKIRINPGNIGSHDRIKAVVDICRKKSIPIRVGVNSGSLEKEILAKHGGVNAEGLCESALRHVKILEGFDFTDIVVAIKSSDVKMMNEANILLSKSCEYPIHLGVTESGSAVSGMIKSSVGIGACLLCGIGDTIRVSLTAPPVEEVYCAKKILAAAGVRSAGIEIVSCPTCGRTKIDLIPIAAEIEKRTAEIIPARPVKVAVMGCAVNGPGEAREADLGIAGGDGEAILFSHGEIIRKIPESDVVNVLMDEIIRLAGI